LVGISIIYNGEFLIGEFVLFLKIRQGRNFQFNENKYGRRMDRAIRFSSSYILNPGAAESKFCKALIFEAVAWLDNKKSN